MDQRVEEEKNLARDDTFHRLGAYKYSPCSNVARSTIFSLTHTSTKNAIFCRPNSYYTPNTAEIGKMAPNTEGIIFVLGVSVYHLPSVQSH